MLTIVAYGSWFYGFGVLVGDISHDLRSPDRTMAIGFGLANVLTGVLGAIAGRNLDRHGVRRIFLAGGLVGGGLLAASSWMITPWSFAFVFGLAGGLIGATGFYSITQAVAARTSPGAPARAIARLTIWGALSSPLFIPAPKLPDSGGDGERRCVLMPRLSSLQSPPTRCEPRWPSGPLAVFCARPAPALGDPTIRRLVGSAAATAAAIEILLLYQVRIMIAVGMAAAAASWFAGARGLAQLLGRLPLTRTVARYGVRTTLVAARIGLALGCVSIVWSGHTWSTLVYVVVAGATIGVLSPLEGIFAGNHVAARRPGIADGRARTVVWGSGRLRANTRGGHRRRHPSHRRRRNPRCSVRGAECPDPPATRHQRGGTDGSLSRVFAARQ